MATVTIRSLDADIVERLKTRAKVNNRSLEAELRQVLTHAAGERPGINRTAVAERIRAMSLRPFQDSDTLPAPGNAHP